MTADHDPASPRAQRHVATQEETVTRHLLVRRALLACGILSSLLFAGTDILAGLRYEGYSFGGRSVPPPFAGDPPLWFRTGLVVRTSVVPCCQLERLTSLLQGWARWRRCLDPALSRGSSHQPFKSSLPGWAFGPSIPGSGPGNTHTTLEKCQQA